MLGQQCHNAEFILGQLGVPSVHIDVTLVKVHHQGPCGEFARLGHGPVQTAGSGMAQGRPHPSQQFAGAEGFRHIVVGAQVQRLHLVVFLGPGRHDDNRHLGPLADVADDLLAVHIRQAQIQQNHFGTMG